MEDTFEGAAGKMQKLPISPVQIDEKSRKADASRKGGQRRQAVSPPRSIPSSSTPTTTSASSASIPRSRANAKRDSPQAQADRRPGRWTAIRSVRFIVDDGFKHGKFDIIAEVVSAPIVAQLRAEEMQRYGMGGRETPRPSPRRPRTATPPMRSSALPSLSRCRSRQSSSRRPQTPSRQCR